MSKTSFYIVMFWLLWSCSPVVDTSPKFAEGSSFNIESSIEYLDRIIKHDPSNASALFQRSKLELQISRTLRAKEDIVTALEEEPLNPDYLVLKAKVDSRLGQFSEAVKTIEFLISQNITVSSLEDQLFIAELYMNSGNLIRSNYFLQKATLTAPHFPDVIYQRAKYYSANRDTAKSEEYYKLLLAKDSVYENGILGLSEIYLHKHVPDSALHLLAKIEKGSTYLYSVLLARSLVQKDREDSASFWWGQALLQSPRLAEAHYQLASYYYSKGNYPSAKSHLASVPENERRRFGGFDLLFAKTCTMLSDSVTAAIYYHKVYLKDSTLLRPKKAHKIAVSPKNIPSDSVK